MLTITTKEYELIKSASAVLWKRLETLSPDERESAEAFCRFSAKLDQRREQDKESQRERMKKFRADPRSADRARYSTLQDLDAGRHTEVDMLAGTAVRLGKELGVPVPCCEFIYHMIKVIEEKNDGKFNFG